MLTMESKLTPIPITKTTRIVVLCGGPSSEREVSLRSGQNCLDALKRLGYSQVTMIDMDTNVVQRLQEYQAEVVFLALHGKYGEDGCVQGLLEILKIPYTGNRVTASALTMNKDLTKTILKAHGLPVLPWVMLDNTITSDNITLPKDLTFPVMVKPVNEGSSVGMTKVDLPEHLATALTQAMQWDAQVMVEMYCEGQALTVGVIDKARQPIATPILEMRPKSGWYDYEAKYTPGKTDFICPAELSVDLTQKIQEQTLVAHRITGCRGLSRIDWMVDAKGHAYILEVNTIPGMTNLSDLPAQAKAMGMEYDSLVECILQSATL